ncbi:MAG: hypothetical protein ABSG45_05635, partial [Nitrososphaerales archaeon]
GWSADVSCGRDAGDRLGEPHHREEKARRLKTLEGTGLAECDSTSPGLFSFLDRTPSGFVTGSTSRRVGPRHPTGIDVIS